MFVGDCATCECLRMVVLKRTFDQEAGDKESAAEKSRADAELKGIFTGILDTLKGGMGKAAATDKKQGGIIASVLGGLGAGLGDLGKGVGKLGIGFAKGL